VERESKDICCSDDWSDIQQIVRSIHSGIVSRTTYKKGGLLQNPVSGVEEVLDAVGNTDEAGRGIAESTLQTFTPALILNRISGRSRLDVLQLRKLLKEYVGGDLTLLGEIPTTRP
jgi:flagellar biosynthesis protein FlhG